LLRSLIKTALLKTSIGDRCYTSVQERWFELTYRRRRELYRQLVASDPDAHRPGAHIARARAKIASRGYTPARRREGEIHTFAYVPSHWSHQNQIAAALRHLGPVTRFDYESRGIELASLRTSGPNHHELRQRLFKDLLEELRRAHRERPLDWFFSYALGWDMTAEFVHRIQEEFGIPTVNISLDDKNWWDVIERRDPASAMKDFVPSYDLGWTSASAVLPWYWALGGQALFLPAGVNSDWFAPVDVEQDVDVGFVGNCFGYRPQILAALRKAGIPVQVHGNNWPEGMLSDEEMRRFFSRCRINLGLGDMHFSRWMTNLKGRDFEVPSTGRGLYLTAYNADLSNYFAIGREIQCYRGVDELIELLWHYLRNQEEAREMARQARLRCLAEHQWIHRYRCVLAHLGVLDANPVSG
jgi:hypothetical protein